MRLFLFTYWYLPDNRTAVNRMKYFKKIFLHSNIETHLIYCDNNSENANENNSVEYKIPFNHLFYSISVYLLKRNRLFFYKIIHFLYLISRKRDVYDFYRNFKEIESSKSFNIGKDDVIITSAPPYSALNIGYYLKKKYGAKWVIDYRDPWTLGYPTLAFSVFADKFRKLIQRKDELKFLELADQITTVSESLKSTFPEKFHHKITVIPNGANTDEMDLSKINSIPNTFSIVYAGTVYPQQLVHNYFFDVVKKFVSENSIKPEDFKLHFIGADSSEGLKSIINHLELNDYVNITKRIDLQELYSYMYNASMFLHFKYADRDKIITSKQYDYLALQKAIVLPQSDNGDIAESIIKNDAGFVCQSKEELYEVLQKEFIKFRNKQDVRIYRSESYVKNVSRDKASEELLKLVFSNVYLQDNINIDQIPPAILHGTI